MQRPVLGDGRKILEVIVYILSYTVEVVSSEQMQKQNLVLFLLVLRPPDQRRNMLLQAQASPALVNNSFFILLSACGWLALLPQLVTNLYIYKSVYKNFQVGGGMFRACYHISVRNLDNIPKNKMRKTKPQKVMPAQRHFSYSQCATLEGSSKALWLRQENKKRLFKILHAPFSSVRCFYCTLGKIY